MIYEYFVSYSHSKGFGRCSVALKKEIDCVADIFHVEELLSNNGAIKTPIVLFFQLLKVIDDEGEM